MKNLKKVLACLLVAAMTLTCFVGALTVSADGTGTIVAGNVEVADDATSVVVPVTINADAALNAAKITVAASQGWVVDAITVADGAAYIDEADVNGGTFLIQANDNVAGFATATVNVAMTSKVACEADVVITLDEVHAATWGEEVVNLAITNGKITVAEPAPVGPVLDETIAVAPHTIAIGETFGVMFRYQLSSLSADYASYRLDIKRTINGGGFNFAYANDSIETANKITSAGVLQFSTYYGIELFSLTAPIEYTLHCFDAEGNEVAYSKTETTTLADIAVAYHDLSTTSDALKKVMADLIQVGAAALNHFTANRTKACDYSTLPVPTIESDFITTELGSLADYSSAEGVAVTITGALQQSPYFNMRFSDNVANKEQYNFEVSYYNALKKKDVTVPVDSSAMTGNTTTISAKLASFPIFATNADVTFKLYKNGEVVATNHYCMEKYIADTMASTTSATLRTLLQEVGEMSQSIRTARKI